MNEEKACGPHMGKSYSYRELPIGATSLGIHEDVIKTGTWRTLRPAFRVKTSPCNEGCPAGVDVRGFITLMKQGLMSEAYKLYVEENPFPAVCGRVCYHPCENACNRRDFDQAVGINALERFLADFPAPVGKESPGSGKQAAVIGSGPAGMSCAYYLARLGHHVVIFEALNVIGGLLRSGIPGYRLPEEVLEKEIEKLTILGVQFKTNCPVTKELWGELEAFDAIVLAHGASEHLSLPFVSPSEGGVGILSGLDFLRRVNLAGEVSLGRRVAVIGGGNTAIDAARVSLRLGAAPTILYRRSRAEMPAFDSEIEEALKEGVEILFLTSPVAIERIESGQRIRCIKNRMGHRDESGRPSPVPVEGSDFFVEVDTIISAIGEICDLSFLPQGIDFSHQSVRVNELGATTRRGVFACGDAIDQPRSVVHAIGSGKRAAIAIDGYLKDQTDAAIMSDLVIGQRGGLSFKHYLEGASDVWSKKVVHFQDLNPDYFQYKARYARAKVPKESRTGFEEVYGNLALEEALGEAQRCFSCGLCDHCGNCYIFCPDGSVSEQEGGPLNVIDYEYCKGCGICANECPIGIIEMEKEG